MTRAGKLFTYEGSVRGYKAQIAAKLAGVDIEVVQSPPDFQLGVTNRTEAFLAQFPLGKVPAFVTSDGKPIFESNAIAYYVASLNGDAGLLGADSVDAALVQQYVSFADEVFPYVCNVVFPCLGVTQYNESVSKKAALDLATSLTALNTILAPRTFLVGERVTLADVSMVCALLMAYEHVLDPAGRAPYTHVNRWFTTCINQPAFKGVIGKFALCTVAKEPVDPERGGKALVEESKPKEATKEVEVKAKETKEEEEDEEEDSAMTAEEKKPNNPFASYPKSRFNMEEFKRIYSNEDTATKAIPYFWKNFDKEGWSIWRADYKFNDELKLIFMSCNLIGGFFQRVEGLRKFAFGSVCVFGRDNANFISGLWVMRGQDLAFNLREDWQVDAPTYDFRKLNPDSEEDRDMVNQFLLWEGKEFTERQFSQGKIFK